MAIKDLPVSRKVIGAFAIVLLTTIGLGLLALNGLSRLDGDANDLSTSKMPAIEVLGTFSMKITHYRAFQASMLMVDDAQRVTDTKIRMRVVKDAEEAWKSYDALVQTAEERKLADDVRQKWDAYLPLEEHELALLKNEGMEAAAHYYTHEMRTAFSALKAAVDKTVAFKHQAGLAAGKQAHATYQEGRIWIFAALIFAAGLASLAGYFLVRGVSKPLQRMTDAMGELARGNLNVEVPCADQLDEIGQLAGAMSSFKNQIQAAEEAKAEQTEVIVTSIGTGLNSLAQGDLTHRISAELSGPFAKLKADFNAALERLQDTVGHVTASSNEIAKSAEEIALSADDLSRRTEHQAAGLEETAAALEQITATVGQTALNAKTATKSAADAMIAAEDGGRVVGTAISAMDAIAQSSKQITDIIGVIDEIAFQTNLLALNAGVEAARAGDAGRGFAVVASEVRALAQRSGQAAKEIKTLIQTSGSHVESGVKLVGESGSALQRIVEQVQQINSLVGEIAKAAAQQSQGVEEVNKAVSQMDQTVQQNAAMVDESTAASRNLAAETERLRNFVGFFSTGGEGLSSAPLRSPAKPAAKPAAKPRVAAQVRPAKRTVNAPAAPAASTDDGWSEF
ncbi:methyl-accepting chemotaxis protein [Rhizomicrobium palustre]|uniref:Methyl-accepting chemotaxis protein n=1 Tax=Rhizomicrobium palustre TaxID=189966 RepID=A0A846N009_9PROT|nr:methyl-accepting chemotaxis protein [Rhizomicrobium palustre]NIK89264.1 methyl-accepting chemotaxis protein [Rhizomicrobium palustre]